MSFRIRGLDPAPFQHLYSLADSALLAQGVKRRVVDSNPGFPDRIEVRDLEVGETALLLNFEHQPAATPYRARHAIFVREGATAALDLVDTVPPVLRRRWISLRAFDAQGMMLGAELAEGSVIEAGIDRLFASGAVAYLHAHYAAAGCFAARIDRAG
ncbi:DUF1203 domain-containing protein [Sphingomonas sp.]|uniref:DUF1203 domain-containing protein n=1 Tax=Sphingomonas sp. TaxID=28214 RepID=UPI001D47A9D5|nr:DUF1203 domain-containing protein [Sphingomonas sp.]MBX9797260.1 DUF1203 domain-containing protein [Sphingomonas sp.]